MFYVLFRQNVLKDAQCCTLRAGRSYSEFPGPVDLPADFKGIRTTLETRYPFIMVACALLPSRGPTGDGNESHQHCGAWRPVSEYGIVSRRFCNDIGRTHITSRPGDALLCCIDHKSRTALSTRNVEPESSGAPPMDCVRRRGMDSNQSAVRNRDTRAGSDCCSSRRHRDGRWLPKRNNPHHYYGQDDRPRVTTSSRHLRSPRGTATAGSLAGSPSILLNPTSLNFSGVAGGGPAPPAKPLTLSNPTGGWLTWTMTETATVACP